MSPSTPITVTSHLICIKVWSSIRSGGSAGGPKAVKQICWEDEPWMFDNEFTPATFPQDPRDPCMEKVAYIYLIKVNQM